MSILMAAGCCCGTPQGQYPEVCGACGACARTIVGQCHLISEINNPDPPGALPAYDIALDMTATAIVFDKQTPGSSCTYVPHAFPNAVVSGIVLDSNPPSFPVACPFSYSCEGFESPVVLMECVELDAAMERMVGTPTAWRIIMLGQCSNAAFPTCEQFGPTKRAFQSYEILCPREVVCPVLGSPKVFRVSLGGLSTGGVSQTSGWLAVADLPVQFTNTSTNSTITVTVLDVSFA